MTAPEGVEISEREWGSIPHATINPFVLFSFVPRRLLEFSPTEIVSRHEVNFEVRPKQNKMGIAY